jgi:hypothetical protein
MRRRSQCKWGWQQQPGNSFDEAVPYLGKIETTKIWNAKRNETAAARLLACVVTQRYSALRRVSAGGFVTLDCLVCNMTHLLLLLSQQESSSQATAIRFFFNIRCVSMSMRQGQEQEHAMFFPSIGLCFPSFCSHFILSAFLYIFLEWLCCFYFRMWSVTTRGGRKRRETEAWVPDLMSMSKGTMNVSIINCFIVKCTEVFTGQPCSFLFLIMFDFASCSWLFERGNIDVWTPLPFLLLAPRQCRRSKGVSEFLLLFYSCCFCFWWCPI